MSISPNSVRPYLRAFDFQKLFIEELGWDHYNVRQAVAVDGQSFILNAVAQKRGFQVFTCESDTVSQIPDHATRRKIEKEVTKSAHEHLIIYVDGGRTIQVWQWVKREPGKPAQSREHTYRSNQPGDSLIQKLQVLQFTLEEEEQGQISLPGVAGRVRAAFDVERVTKRFYDRFKAEHAAFLKFLKGIPDKDFECWYVSVMLNRLMFIYFIQKKGFLNEDQNYLRTKLAESHNRGKDRFYRDFLCPLFFEGFAKKAADRSQPVNNLLGKIPYLNGGLFLRHQIEEAYGKDIQIKDAAFERLFSFFEQYHWHLDERPLRQDNEINPDVLGYIFEKYINQKQMGAYYTKEDITGYISQNTVIPSLFDTAQRKCKIAFEGEQSVWRLLQADPDRYIYEAVRRGVVDPDGNIIPENRLPDFVQKGMCNPKARMFDKSYNLGEAVITDAEGNNLALPTETWREYVERRRRCLELRAKLASGEIHSVNDLITYNLDIRQISQDVIENSEGPELLRAFYNAIEKVTILDPACGSGAFLFAALNILEPLYEACLDRMESFLEDLERSGEKHRPEKFSDFRKTLNRVEQHPNRRYFILKSIILHNLYGVDIMEEATEICKLRLFLKLVAQIDSVEKIEPLPDIDFNIRAGNSLVGYATYQDVQQAVNSKLDFEGTLQKIEEKAQDVDRLFSLFRLQQTEIGAEVTTEDKAELKKRLKFLEEELNEYLAGEHGIKIEDRNSYRKWLESHRPFHWFVEFYGIMTSGGFDTVIGNPPYVVYPSEKVEYAVKESLYVTINSKNLYALFFERSLTLGRQHSPVGLIVQLTSLSSERAPSLQNLLLRRGTLVAVSFPRRPESIFESVEMPVAILLSNDGSREIVQTTKVNRMYTEERPHVTQMLTFRAHGLRADGHRIPKIGSATEETLYRKVASNSKPLAMLLCEQSKWVLYYQEACRYWAKATYGLPYFRRDGKVIDPPHGRTLFFENSQGCSFAFCLANSSLFYWLYSLLSDCEHINDRLIRNFLVPPGWCDSDWAELSKRLIKGIRENATRKRIRTRQGHTIEYDEIKVLHSKPIIDEIDRTLAKHYGFTGEELDFIINYDIKYRMRRNGAEADAED